MPQDKNRPINRRELSPKEHKAMDNQRKKQKEYDRKQAKKEAKYREKMRKQNRKSGGDGHIVVTIPGDQNKNTVEHRQENRNPNKNAQIKANSRDTKKVPKRKSEPDIIKSETNKRVRDLKPTDHEDGYYVNEVRVRKEQAKKVKEKRKKEQRKPMSPKKRRRIRIIVSVSILLVIFIVGVVLSLTVLFKTENISVEGNKYYEDKQIIDLSGVVNGENIFIASMTGNTDAIKKSLPYIKDAHVSFQIPNKVVITVENEKPYYCLKSDGDYYLVNKDGKILEKTDKKTKGLMYVAAPKLKNAKIGSNVQFVNKKVTKAISDIVASETKNNFTKITSVDLRKMSNITLTYDNRIKIKLGLPNDIDYKLRTAFAIINEKLDPNKTGKVKGVLNVSQCKDTKKSYFKEDGHTATVATGSTSPSTASSTYSNYYAQSTTYSSYYNYGTQAATQAQTYGYATQAATQAQTYGYASQAQQEATEAQNYGNNVTWE